MENVVDYQKVFDAFQKEWLEHPMILTENGKPVSGCCTENK